MPEPDPTPPATTADPLLDAFAAWQHGYDAGREPAVEDLSLSPDLRDALRKLIRRHKALHPPVPAETPGAHAPGSPNTPGADAPASPPAPPPPDPPGYVLHEEIGRGGMGVVYRATDTAFGREVAVKVVRPDRRTGAAADRFRTEAGITARLDHPAIPPVHALGELQDGSPFLAMKRVRGRTLAAVLKGTDRPDLIAAFERVCQGVGHAHARGVVHRDLKPGNVMVGDHAAVYVMDWGLAREVAGDDDPGRRESASGTPAYMAPEQARGEPATARSDVFALGGVLCAILTGGPPFAGKDSGEQLRQAKAADLADALGRLERCGADPGLAELCKRCLSADPAGRPADAGAVAAEVGGLRAAADDRAKRAEVDRHRAEVRAAEERKRRRAQLALGSAVLVALLLGGGLAGWQWRRAEGALADVTAEQGRTAEQLEKTQQAEAVAGRRAAVIARVADPVAVVVAAEARDRFLGLPKVLELTPEKRTGMLVRSLTEVMTALGDLDPGDPSVPLPVRRLLATGGYVLGSETIKLKKWADADRLLAQAAGWYEAVVVLDPADSESRNQHANALYLLGVIARDAGRPIDHRRWWEQSLRVSEKLAADRPEVAGFRENVGRCQYNLAMLELDEKREDAARERLTAAIDTLRPVVKPKQPGAWFLCYAHRFRADRHPKGSAERLRDLTESARWANTRDERKEVTDGLEDDLPADAPAAARVGLARVFAVAADGARGRKAEADGYAGRAVEQLRRARAAGLTPDADGWTPVRQDPDFAPVRGHPDWPALDR